MTDSGMKIVNEALEIYKGLLDKIANIHKKSDEYPIFNKSEIGDLLYNTEKYIRQAFYNITNAQGIVTEEEQVFMDSLKLFEDRHEKANENEIIESVNSSIPEYVELAKKVDGYALTNYAEELLKDTLAIFKLLMNVDGNTYADESSFTYAFMHKLEKYIKSN